MANLMASDEASNIYTSVCVVFVVMVSFGSLLPVGDLTKRAEKDVEPSPATLTEGETSRCSVASCSSDHRNCALETDKLHVSAT